MVPEKFWMAGKTRSFLSFVLPSQFVGSQLSHLSFRQTPTRSASPKSQRFIIYISVPTSLSIMEDRHYLGEPRPIKGLELLTWDVDILREAVDHPIMTIRVDANNLPPRKRKKKVVWKLPDSFEHVPKFGKEDKIRILELFKQQKKSMKKEKRKQTGDTTTCSGGSPSRSQDSDQPPRTSAAGEVPPDEDSPKQISEFNGVASAELPAQPKSLMGPPGLSTLSLDEKKDGSSDAGNGHDETAVFASMHRSSEMSNSLPPPPGIFSANGDVPPPISSTFHPAPPGIPITARYFHIPVPLHNSPPMNISEVVTQSYYMMLTHGHIRDLKLYYAPSATKSLTVGGAHAICHSEEDKDMQLQSLVGMVVAIRGVLQQTIPTSSSPSTPMNNRADSILVVITGMCVRPHALPFCHTLVLIARPEGYQIQNDALCFLTTETEAGTVA